MSLYIGIKQPILECSRTQISNVIGARVRNDKDKHKPFTVNHSYSHLEDECAQKLLFVFLEKEMLNLPQPLLLQCVCSAGLVEYNEARWGLDSGADVSDNGVCHQILLDAVYTLGIPGSKAEELEELGNLLRELW